MQISFWEAARTSGRDPNKISDPTLIGVEESVKHGGHKNGAALVRLDDRRIQFDIFLVESGSQCLTGTCRMSELSGQGNKRPRRFELRSRTLHFTVEQVCKCEMLEKCNNI